jgi:hypothetical protein
MQNRPRTNRKSNLLRHIMTPDQITRFEQDTIGFVITIQVTKSKIHYSAENLTKHLHAEGLYTFFFWPMPLYNE